MFDNKGSKKNLQIQIENLEFRKEYNYMLMVQLEGDEHKRISEISAIVKEPVFKTNTFNIPLQEDKLTKNPTIMISAMVAP